MLSCVIVGWWWLVEREASWVLMALVGVDEVELLMIVDLVLELI